jgi:hypothetical protein
VIDVPDRVLAFANIKKAAEYYGVNVSENSRQELGMSEHEVRNAL